jgi:hypothetical protein
MTKLQTLLPSLAKHPTTPAQERGQGFDWEIVHIRNDNEFVCPATDNTLHG